MKDYSFELSVYRQANTISQKGGTVVLSSGDMARMPISEMAMNSMLNLPVYNRGIAHLTVEDAANMLEDCVFSLEPRNVVVALGSEDLKNPAFDLKEFMNKYEWLLYSMNSRLKCRIYIASVISASPMAATVNAALKNLASACGCRYIDISRTTACDNPMLRMFDIMRTNLRERPISFSEAMSLPL
jgi:hypothetical protein